MPKSLPAIWALILDRNGVFDMTKIDIDAVEARIDELRGEHTAAWHVHNDAIGALPGDATLRDMDARRDKAAELTRDALDDQERIAAELVEAAGDALDWARGYLDSGDESGLDGMTDEELTRVFNRAIRRGNHDRALGAARVLESSGDARMMHVLSAQHDDTRAALAYLDEWRDDPSRVLDDIALKMSAVRMPDDSRIGPNADVARRIADEDAARRAAEEAAALEARRKLHDELSRPLSGGKARSVESRQSVKRAPFGYNR